MEKLSITNMLYTGVFCHAAYSVGLGIPGMVTIAGVYNLAGDKIDIETVKKTINIAITNFCALTVWNGLKSLKPHPLINCLQAVLMFMTLVFNHDEVLELFKKERIHSDVFSIIFYIPSTILCANPIIGSLVATTAAHVCDLVYHSIFKTN